MPSTSAIVNRSLRETIGPLLRDAGFTKIDPRNGWRWLDKAIWVFNIRSVGNYFSSVTGWPPGSVSVSLGVFYTFMPRDLQLKADDHHRPLPAEHQCHTRANLECGLDQDGPKGRLANPAERRRKDLWWIEPDGANTKAVASDIAISLHEFGLPWYSSNSNLASALAHLEGGRDCFVKFDRAALVARELGERDRWLKYAALAEAEANRIGRTVDRLARYGV